MSCRLWSQVCFYGVDLASSRAEVTLVVTRKPHSRRRGILVT